MSFIFYDGKKLIRHLDFFNLFIMKVCFLVVHQNNNKFTGLRSFT